MLPMTTNEQLDALKALVKLQQEQIESMTQALQVARDKNLAAQQECQSLRKDYTDLYRECHMWKENSEYFDDQILGLSAFIMDNVPGEPSQNEGAVECAIRIIEELQVDYNVLFSKYTGICQEIGDELGVVLALDFAGTAEEDESVVQHAGRLLREYKELLEKLVDEQMLAETVPFRVGSIKFQDREDSTDAWIRNAAHEAGLTAMQCAAMCSPNTYSTTFQEVYNTLKIIVP